MSANNSSTRRLLLRTAMLAAIGFGLPLAACDSISGLDQEPTASGTWSGAYTIVGAPELGTVPLTLSVAQLEGGVLEGKGAFTGGTGQIPVVFTGQHSHPSVTGRLILGDDAMELTASMDSDGEAITGELRSGNVRANLKLSKQ